MRHIYGLQENRKEAKMKREKLLKQQIVYLFVQ